MYWDIELTQIAEERNKIVKQIRETPSDNLETLENLEKALERNTKVLNIKKNAQLSEENDKREQDKQGKVVATLSQPEVTERKIEKTESEKKLELRSNYIELSKMWAKGDKRTMTTSSTDTAEGGSLIQPLISDQIWRAIVNATQIRNCSFVKEAPQDIKIATQQSIGAGADAAEGNPMALADDVFGSELLSPIMHTGEIKYTISYLQDVSYNFPEITEIIVNDVGLRIGIDEEQDFITYLSGSLGAQVGVTTAASNSIADTDLIDLYYAVPQIVRKQSTWLISDGAMPLITKLRDAGHYLFFPMDKAGMLNEFDDIIKGRPCYVDSYLPAVAPNAKVAYFGDFAHRFVIGQRGGLQVRLLDQKYIDTEQAYAICGWLRSACVLTHKNAIQAMVMGDLPVS